jgi:sigma-E factor negative regulatory protein RseA
MSNEELDSQLSAMFDDELSQAECELLARRIARDPALKERWGRYALIGAAVRAEVGVKLDTGIAQRVSVALTSEPALDTKETAATRAAGGRFTRWQQAVGGLAVAATVAAMSILLLRVQNPGGDTLVADQGASAVAPAGIVDSGEPDSYIVPTVVESPSIIPTAELANYVVAHSEFSTPLVRRNTLSTLMASDNAAGDELEAMPASEPESESADAQTR